MGKHVTPELCLTEQLSNKCSDVKSIQDFFGIVITKVDENSELYNIYSNGELILTKINSWDIGSIMGRVGLALANELCEQACLDTNLEEAETAQVECEKGHSFMCPLCREFANC